MRVGTRGRTGLPGTTIVKGTEVLASEKWGSCLELNNCPLGSLCPARVQPTEKEPGSREGPCLSSHIQRGRLVASSISILHMEVPPSQLLRENPWGHLWLSSFSHTPPLFQQKHLVGSTFKTHPRSDHPSSLFLLPSSSHSQMSPVLLQ